MENGKALEYRANVRMTEDLYNSINYWAEKKGVKVTDYIRDALLLQIKRDNKDYDLPSLEAHRLNQIIDTLEMHAHAADGRRASNPEPEIKDALLKRFTVTILNVTAVSCSVSYTLRGRKP